MRHTKYSAKKEKEGEKNFPQLWGAQSCDTKGSNALRSRIKISMAGLHCWRMVRLEDRNVVWYRSMILLFQKLSERPHGDREFVQESISFGLKDFRTYSSNISKNVKTSYWSLRDAWIAPDSFNPLKYGIIPTTYILGREMQLLDPCWKQPVPLSNVEFSQKLIFENFSDWKRRDIMEVRKVMNKEPLKSCLLPMTSLIH